jgi:hypothetical protein
VIRDLLMFGMVSLRRATVKSEANELLSEPGGPSSITKPYGSPEDSVIDLARLGLNITHCHRHYLVAFQGHCCRSCPYKPTRRRHRIHYNGFAIDNSDLRVKLEPSVKLLYLSASKSIKLLLTNWPFLIVSLRRIAAIWPCWVLSRRWWVRIAVYIFQATRSEEWIGRI